jgi:hypothetical protein
MRNITSILQDFIGTVEDNEFVGRLFIPGVLVRVPLERFSQTTKRTKIRFWPDRCEV